MAKQENNNKKKHALKGFKAELKKVIWPTPNQVVKNTTAVVVIVLITAAIVFVLDTCFNFINSKGINKIKEKIRNTTVVETVVDDTTEEVNNDEETSNVEQTEQEDSTNVEE